MKYGKTTYTGRIVYDRPKHVFTTRDIVRISEAYIRYSSRQDWEDPKNAGRIRALYYMFARMYSSIRHIFIDDITHATSENLRQQILRSRKEWMGEFIEIVGNTVSVATLGIAGDFTKYMGHLIDDWVEELIIGDVTELVEEGEQDAKSSEGESVQPIQIAKINQ